MILPIQKLSQADKEKRHEKTGKNNIEETIDFYIESCNWTNHTEEILSLYRAVEGYLDSEQYKLIQNPYNKQKDDDSNPVQFNALLQNFNILRGIANLLMGEFGRRGHEYQVAQINPSDEMAFKDGLDIVIKDYYAQAVANSLLDFGLDVGQQAKQLPPLEQYVAEFKGRFDETRLISGQEVLDYIKYNCDLDSKYLDLYWDWIVTGGFYSYKDVNHDDVSFEVVPRHELYVPTESHSRFIEDYSFAVRRRVLPVYKVVDIFRGRIEEEVIDALEKEIQSGVSLQFSDIQMTGRNGALRLPTLHVSSSNFNILNSATNGVELFHVVYKTWKPYYVLTYIDPILGESTMEVGEGYVLNKAQGDIRLEKFWENILYEGYRCLGYYLDCKPLLENRADLNQEGLQKLPYNGTHERSSTGEIQSLIKEGLPYQRKINVLHYQVEKLINKNKDKLTVMPYGLVPRKKGMDTKSQMYHADATSILWVDETAPNAAHAAQMIKVLDMSLGNFIKEALGIIQATKQEYWESIGMNAQRYADVGQNAGKAVTEQAITRSAIITYELTRQFDKVIEKDYAGLLDLSKLAYINGKKAKYIRSDSSIAFLNMNQDGAKEHSENSYNVFVRDSSMMTEAILAMRGQAVNLIQNGGDMAVLGHLYQTNNVAKLTKILADLDKGKREYEQLVADKKAEADMLLQESVNANDAANRAEKRYEVDMTYQGTIDSALIRSDANSSRNEARPDSPLEQTLAEHKIQKDNKDLAIKEKVADSTITKNKKINTNK